MQLAAEERIISLPKVARIAAEAYAILQCGHLSKKPEFDS